jgi:hypothetical protein
LCASIVLGMAAAAPAQAAFGVTVNKAEPVSKSAGANSQFDLDVSFTGGEDVKDLTVHLPPGLVGDPTSTVRCTEVQLNADACPAGSQIGTTITTATVVLPSDTVINGSVYNVEPRTGEPARLGVVLRPDTGGTVILQSPARLRSSDFGLDTVLEDIPNTAVVAGLTVPITIARIQLSLNGAFMRNPTSCGVQTTTADAVSYPPSNTAATASASFTSLNCAALPFSPEFTGNLGSPGHTAPFTKPPQTTVISQDDGEAGLRRAQVKLPADVGGDNPYLSNTCPPANFVAHTCPDASIVGQATAESPLQEEALTGPMALVHNPGGLPLLGLDLEGALALQLYGNLVISLNGEGNLETMVLFNGLPDIPISRFELTLVEDRLNIVGRDLCEPPPFFYTTHFTSFGDEVETGDVQATIDGCPPPVVDPTATLKLNKATSANPRLRAKVTQGSAFVDEATVKAPPEVNFRDGKYTAKADGAPVPESAIQVSRKEIIVAAAPDTEELRIRAGGGGVHVKHSVVPGQELAFSVDVTDLDANHFSLPTPVIVN